MVTLTPVGEHTFRIETEENFGSEGELAIFEMDASGKVVRLVMGNGYVDAVDQW
jgi:hypothetical protein